MPNSKSSIADKRYGRETKIELKAKAKSNFFSLSNRLAKLLSKSF